MMTLVLFAFFVLVALIVCCPRVGTAGTKVGVNARVYRNTGTYGTPTWTNVGKIKDDMESGGWEMAEAGSRETLAKLYAKTRIDIGEQVVIRADDVDAGYTAFANASVSQTAVLDLLILDGPITREGARGYRGEFLINQVGKGKEIDAVIYATFELKATDTANGFPSYVVMGAASVPTITPF